VDSRVRENDNRGAISWVPNAGGLLTLTPLVCLGYARYKPFLVYKEGEDGKRGETLDSRFRGNDGGIYFVCVPNAPGPLKNSAG